MRSLSLLTDYRSSPNTSRIRDLQKDMTNILVHEHSELATFRESFDSDIAKTNANVKAMRIAVSKSKQPGAIDYGQTLPDEKEISTLRSLLANINTSESQLLKARHEADLVLGRERARWTQPNPSGRPRTLSDWFQVYGKPSRTLGPFERSLSLVCRPISIVSGARSADGLVSFKTERSQATKLRLGTLIN